MTMPISVTGCLTCSDPVTVTRRHPRDQKYCSRKCWAARPVPEYVCGKCGPGIDYRVRRDGARVCRTCEYTNGTARRKADPERSRARTRRWRENNLDASRAAGRASVRKWRAANPDKVREAARRDYEQHTERYLRHVEGRKRLIASAVNDFTVAQWDKLKADYNQRCVYCNKVSPILERDHIVPVSKGGDNTLANIVPACRGCNRAKGVKLTTPPHMRAEFH
jgi:5-methylcytosine-specific restriction endonuclease McrA